ncbi:hypothetical protein DMH03_33850 [Amycolatopsis sp. WAC 01376]|uniref:hypothetical protein n=1 Tax=Amycolatopsis sp. WAC 01376 TaxID=2203195 RepID=UPI000F7B77ED|nr:hypothetical protein [Amycolatopsis sp. WAC 01376]RSM55166.1 hypothetical protein DMH03_33850 [Amycolatopsis sp. WAC 01376]
MYFDDSIAQEIPKTHDPSSSNDVRAQRPIRRLLRALWSGARQVAWGIDAFSSVRHSIDVPPDHGARNRPRRCPATREGPVDGRMPCA